MTQGELLGFKVEPRLSTPRAKPDSMLSWPIQVEYVHVIPKKPQIPSFMCFRGEIYIDPGGGVAERLRLSVESLLCHSPAVPHFPHLAAVLGEAGESEGD